MFKERAPYGEFLDKHRIQQERVKEETGLNKDTITKACNDKEYRPKGGVKKLLVSAAKLLSGKEVSDETFWPTK